MHKPFLTIAIPTFNRSKVLDKSLESITEQEVFKTTQNVEIVVCDNCSSDDTEKVCQKYLAIYPSKFFYYKNTTNIGDKNFEKSLSLGTGEFLKLSNDSLLYKQNSLQKMLELIKKNKEKKPTLFFLNNKHPTPTCIYETTSAEDFLSKVSFWVTWIGGFGIWKIDFDNLIDFNRRSDTNLTQVDVIFRLLSQPNKNAVIDNSRLFKVQKLPNKGGYNFFNVFVTNYFHILDSFQFNADAIKTEKKRILLKHVVVFDAKSYFANSFAFENRFNILFKNTKNIRFVIPMYYVFYIFFFFFFFVKFSIVEKIKSAFTIK